MEYCLRFAVNQNAWHCTVLDMLCVTENWLPCVCHTATAGTNTSKTRETWVAF